jgi:hypothetical protein
MPGLFSFHTIEIAPSGKVRVLLRMGFPVEIDQEGATSGLYVGWK